MVQASIADKDNLLLTVASRKADIDAAIQAYQERNEYLQTRDDVFGQITAEFIAWHGQKHSDSALHKQARSLSLPAQQPPH